MILVFLSIKLKSLDYPSVVDAFICFVCFTRTVGQIGIVCLVMIHHLHQQSRNGIIGTKKFLGKE